MRMIEVAGATHIFKAPENWDPRNGPCQDATARLEVVGEPDAEGKRMVTTTVAWMPSPEERRKIAAGAVLEIVFCSNVMPAHRAQIVETVAPEEVSHGAAAISINEDAHGMGYDEHGPATP